MLASVTAGFFASYVFLAALAVGLLAMYLQSMSFAELATMIPKAGSMNEYVRAGLGPYFFATLTVLVGYIAVQLFPTTAEAYTPSAIVKGFLWTGGPSTTFWVIVFVVLVALLNVAGIRPYGAVEVALTVFIILSLLVFGFIGLAGLGSSDPIGSAFPHVPFTWSLFSTLLGIAMFTFVGMEYTCPLAEEIENPARNIPLGIFLGLTLVTVPIVIWGLGATRYVPSDQLERVQPGGPHGGRDRDPGRHRQVVDGDHLAGRDALDAERTPRGYLPRILYGMSLTRQLPRAFGYLLPSTRAPGRRDRRRRAHADSHERLHRSREEHELHRAHPRGCPRVGYGLRDHPPDYDHPPAAEPQARVLPLCCRARSTADRYGPARAGAHSKSSPSPR